MALPRRVILHVGMAKAGSTAVQNFMADRYEALLEQGVLFPLSILRRSNPLDPIRTPGHIDLIQQIDAAEETPLLAECTAAGDRAHTLFLSMENLFNISGDRSVEKLGRFLAGCEVHLLAVLRAPHEWLASRYYEVVTTGLLNEIRSADRYAEEVLASGALDYAARLDFLERALGASSLRVFDHAALTGATNVVRTFVDALGIDLPVSEAEGAQRVNASVAYPESTEAHRRTNVLVRGLPQLERFAFARRMKAEYSGLAARGLLRAGGAPFSPATRAAIVTATSGPCRTVAARHFGDRPFGTPEGWAATRPPALDGTRVAALQKAGFEAYLAEVERAGPPRRTSSSFDFAPEPARRLREAYAGARVVLEYGSGGSTLLAASLPGKLVFCVEADRLRALRMRARLAAADLPSPVVVRYADAGEDVDAEAVYTEAIWDETWFRHPDVVLIQGRLRSACFAAVAARISRPVVVLVDAHEGMRRRDRALKPVWIRDGVAEYRLNPRPPETAPLPTQGAGGVLP